MSSSDNARRRRRKNSSGPSGRREMDQRPARDSRAAPYPSRDSRAADRDRRPRRKGGTERQEGSQPRQDGSQSRRADSVQRQDGSQPRRADGVQHREGGQPRRDPRGYGQDARRDRVSSRTAQRDDSTREDGGIYNSRGGGRSREYRRTYAPLTRASEDGSPAYSGTGGAIEEQRYAASRRNSPPSRRRRQKSGRRLRRRHLLPVFLLPTLVLAAVLFTGNRLLFQEPVQQMEPITAPVQQTEPVSDQGQEAERVPFSSVSVIPEELRNLVSENAEDTEEEFDWDAAFPDDPDTELEDLSQEVGHKTRKKDFFTFLVAGRDNNNGGSDTMILASLDKNGKKITGISLPRDTKCYVDNKARKLNYAFNNGGIDNLAKTVSWQLGIPIDYTVVVDLNGFAALVDAIGGVDFDVPIDMDYDDPAQDLYIGFEKGMQHLDGKDALKVVRFRHNWDGTGYGDEDLGRMRTQQQFLKAVAKKMLTPANINKVGKFADIFRQYVKTNLSLGNLAWLGKEAIFIGADGVDFSTLPGEWTYPYIYLNQEKVLALLNERMNPYEEPMTAWDLHIAK